MKIDIHTHTKKTKQGDAETREIGSDEFHEIVSSTEVKIIAITNHNVFDIEQYQEFITEVVDDFQIWPGVELDVIKDSKCVSVFGGECRSSCNSDETPIASPIQLCPTKTDSCCQKPEAKK